MLLIAVKKKWIGEEICGSFDREKWGYNNACFLTFCEETKVFDDTHN